MIRSLNIPIKTLIKFFEDQGYREYSRDNNYIHFEKDPVFGRPLNSGSDFITIVQTENIGGKVLESALSQMAIPVETFIDNLRSMYALSVKKSIIGYIDVLGFISRIEDANRDQDQLNNFLKEFHNAIAKSYDEIQRNLSQKKYYNLFKQSHVRVFSDNLIIIQECSEQYQGEKEIASVIQQVAQYQLDLALSGFFSRGAITVGNAYCDYQIIFGMPIITAYQLENEKAVVPRIIFDDDLKKLLTDIIESFNFVRPDDYFLSDSIVQDSDEKWFINYLWIIKLFNDDMIYWESLGSEDIPRHCTYFPGAIEELEKHKEKIIANLMSYRDDKTGIRKKYEWLAEYHNYFCENFFSSENSILIEGYPNTHRFSAPIREIINNKNQSRYL